MSNEQLGYEWNEIGSLLFVAGAITLFIAIIA